MLSLSIFAKQTSLDFAKKVIKLNLKVAGEFYMLLFLIKADSLYVADHLMTANTMTGQNS